MVPDTIVAMLGPLGRVLSPAPPTTDAAIRTQAFTDFYMAQFDRVYAYLRYRLDDPSLAEDLAAEVFVRAWAKLGDRPPSDAAVAWLFTTARNLIADHYRGRRAAVPLEALPDAGQPTTDPPEQQLVADEQRTQLMRCLAELGEREREVIGLRFIAGLRHRQIARVIGTSEGNVAKIMHRALRKLRTRLHNEENDHV